MKPLFTFFLILINFLCSAQKEDYLLSLIKKAETEESLVIVYTAHDTISFGSFFYDDYFKILKLESDTSTIKKEFTATLHLFAEGISEIEEAIYQVRFLDITTAMYTTGKQQKEKCADKMHLTNGEILDVAIVEMNDGIIRYKKCSKNDPRVYNKDTRDVERINLGSHSEIAFNKQAPLKKKDRTHLVKAVGITMGFSLLFFICATIISL